MKTTIDFLPVNKVFRFYYCRLGKTVYGMSWTDLHDFWKDDWKVVRTYKKWTPGKNALPLEKFSFPPFFYEKMMKYLATCKQITSEKRGSRK